MNLIVPPQPTTGTGESLDFAARLDRFAEITVRVGLNIAPGQELLLTAPIEARDLVRRITEHAYKAGASLVTALLADEEMALARFRHAAEGSFDRAANWLYNGMAEAFRGGAARLAIAGEDPALLGGQDPERVARANRARSMAYKPALDLIANSAINWTVIACPTAAWARAMFPGEDEVAALAKLWDAVFAACRVDRPDPVAAWAEHNAKLTERRAALDARRFAALHFRGPGTDLRVGLAEGHAWKGGLTTAANGITGNPNLPTEEVFTTPHAAMTEGTVSSTKPLSYQGTLIRDIRVRFEGGRIVAAHAATGQNVLERMIGTDDGARRLGEVALVPHSSPISQSGLLFLNTLFDENAASHIALGQSYSKCFQDAETATPAELAVRGANSSLIHVDWMIGSGEVDVDGIAADGSAEPVMRRGEWA